MYKLLLVSDREEILNAFDQIENWERHGFKKPHIRHDYEGMLDSLAKHHADGISIAVVPEEAKKIYPYLQANYPNVPIFEAGETEDEILRYLNELNILLNRIHADFSNDGFTEIDMLMECRHEFFRKLLTGRVENKDDLVRNMHLLRSRMDPEETCMIMELAQPSATEQDKLEGRWHYGQDRLELTLRQSFGGDVQGVLRRFGNVLEPVTAGAHPEIREIARQMLENGAEPAMMSGSGPTVFGIVKDKETGGKIAGILQAQRLETAVAYMMGRKNV